jgi:outer membrane protein W
MLNALSSKSSAALKNVFRLAHYDYPATINQSEGTMNLSKPFLIFSLLGIFCMTSRAESLPALHRIGILEAGVPYRTGETLAWNYTFEAKVLSYEYLSSLGVSAEIAPLNLTAWRGTVERGPFTDPGSLTATTTEEDRKAKSWYYIPVTLRYYQRTWMSHAWPFIGIGMGYHHFEQDQLAWETKTSHSGFAVVPEVGFDFGTRTGASHIVTLRVYPGSSTGNDNALVALSYGYRWSPKDDARGEAVSPPASPLSVAAIAGAQIGNHDLLGGPAGFGWISYRALPFLALDLRGGVSGGSGRSGTPFSDSITRVASIELYPRLIWNTQHAHPYVGAGLGYFMPHNNTNGLDDDALKSNVGGLIGAGVEIPVNAHVDVVIDYTYQILTITHQSPGVDDSKILLNGSRIGAGIQFHI